jgi:hypothetical protein
MDIIQRDFDNIAKEWNSHRIRPSHYAESPGGIPDVLYFCPQTAGAERHHHPVCEEELEAAARVVRKKRCTVPPEFTALAEAVMRDGGYEVPLTATEAKKLYLNLLHTLDN